MKPARRDGEQRREALLDAALRCFVAQGVLQTGIEDIRKEAGASPSRVYHLFDGLNGLTLALLVRTFERLFGHLGSRVLAARTAEATVTALVDGHLEWVLSHRDEARFMYQAMALELGKDGAAALAARKAELLAPVVQHLRPFILSGALPRWSPLLFDVVLLGPSHEACRRLLAGAELEPAWLRAELPRLAWRCVAEVPVATKKPRARSSRTRGSE
jgi:AcrR family transcriptional regulator